MPRVGQQAIVVGAGMGGLLAARALADHFDRVTVLERDPLPESYDPRKGVPQGRHTHGLLARGREILEEHFPGLTDELIGEGAVPGDLVNDGYWFNYGVYLHNAPSDMLGLGVSRPMLEGYVRRRLSKLQNVRVLDRIDVVEPTFEPVKNCVTGVRIRSKDGSGATDTMLADLVIDASGRGSSTPAWLKAAGFTSPPEEEIAVNIRYVTRIYRLEDEHIDVGLHGKRFCIMGACRPDFRFGALLQLEGRRWSLSIGGYMGDFPREDEAGFLEFARSLPKPEIFNVIRDAEALSAITPYNFSSNHRRRYEKLSRFPHGLLVYGDALCSFDPIYGQGMTVACVQSVVLNECLKKGTTQIAERFFKGASRCIDTPWQIAVGADLQNPRVQGKRSTPVRFINWYVEKFYRAAQNDAELAIKFLEVANLKEPPAALMSPKHALKVFHETRAAA